MHPEEEDMQDQPTGDALGIAALYTLALFVTGLLSYLSGCFD